MEYETRTCRVSRMREAIALDEAAAYPEDSDLVWARSAAEFREKPPRYCATFVASPPVMRWVRCRGWRMEEVAHGGRSPEVDRIRIRLRFDIEEEAMQFALIFGAEIEVSERAELALKVLAGARAIPGKPRCQTP